MIEKTYCGKETEVTLTKYELECMLDEAKNRGRCEATKENEKLKEVLRVVGEWIKIVTDE